MITFRGKDMYLALLKMSLIRLSELLSTSSESTNITVEKLARDVIVAERMIIELMGTAPELCKKIISILDRVVVLTNLAEGADEDEKADTMKYFREEVVPALNTIISEIDKLLSQVDETK